MGQINLESEEDENFIISQGSSKTPLSKVDSNNSMRVILPQGNYKNNCFDR